MCGHMGENKMKIADEIVKSLSDIIKNKKILEIACGDSEFSLSASKYASEIFATDISLERFYRRNIKEIPDNIKVYEMNAAELKLKDEEFDLTFCYNAIGHLVEMKDLVLSEMLRVTKKGGLVVLIATWTMDKKILYELHENWVRKDNGKDLRYMQNSKYSILIIEKNFCADQDTLAAKTGRY